MADALDKRLERWLSAGVVDASTAARIRTFEESQGSSERLRWPVLLAVALGGVLLCAGVLLFVAAHWDELSPAWRFTLVLMIVAVFPLAGALTETRFSALSPSFYATGTICAGVDWRNRPVASRRIGFYRGARKLGMVGLAESAGHFSYAAHHRLGDSNLRAAGAGLRAAKERGVDKCDRGGLGSGDRNVPRHA